MLRATSWGDAVADAHLQPACAVTFTFDMLSNGAPLSPDATIGGALFDDITFSNGNGLLTATSYNALGGYAGPNTIPLMPHSPPNVAYHRTLASGGSSGPVTASVAPNSTFSLVQFYLGYVENAAYHGVSSGFSYDPPVTVSVTGTVLGVPVASCAYDHIFDDPPGSLLPMVLVTTPGCTGVDEISITDHTIENFYLDDMQFILS